MKHFLLLKICFNKIGKMLKQMRMARESFNKWKKLGDKTARFRDDVEAILIII